jgi:hypothetical protein
VGPNALSVMLVAAALAWGGLCSAESALVESYEAAGACPDASWFESELRQRLAGTAVVHGQLRVRLKALDAGFAGSIQRVGESPDLGTREVTHESCAQVVQALALIGAMWLAPDAPPQPNAKPFTPAPEARPAPLTATKSARISRFSHGPAIGLATQALVAPEMRVGLRLAYRVGWKHAYSESELWLSWTRLESGTLTIERNANATLTYDAAQLRVCEAVALLRSLWLSPCVLFDVGVLRGTGTVANAGSVTRDGAWWSAGVAGKLEWRLQPLLFVATSAGLIYPFARPAFHFSQPGADPSLRAIFNVPAKPGFSGDLLLGLRFL